MEEILDLLDWNMPSEVQAKGISLAREAKTIVPFLQPLTSKHNKNVWDNCAVVIAEKSDEELRPYLVELLEWLQDMNWPGAFCILDRLKKYADHDSLCKAVNVCIQEARKGCDEIWESNLSALGAAGAVPVCNVQDHFLYRRKP